MTLGNSSPRNSLGRRSGPGQAGRGHHRAETCGNRAFAEYFLLCSGSSQPQIKAIGEAIEERLDREGVRLAHREGKAGAEWVLLDYGDFVVHIFSERARQYYDLERLWRNAERIDFPAPGRPHAQEPHAESEGDAAHR